MITPEQIHDAITRQIYEAFHSEIARGVKYPAIDTFASRDAIREYLAAYPRTMGGGCSIPLAGIKFGNIAGTRVFVLDRPGIWFLTIIRQAH